MGFWSAVSDVVCWTGEKCETASRATLNFVSGSGRWGDHFYDGVMQPAIERHVSSLPESQISAIANPNSVRDFGALLSAGGHGSVDTVRDTAGHIMEALSGDSLGALKPLLIGVGVLGAGYLALEMATGNPR